MTTNIPYDDVGMAGYATEDFATVALLSGTAPTITTAETLLDQNADLPAFTVVGRITTGGKITICNPSANDGSQVPIGITTAKALDTGADQSVSIFRDGVFNPDALNWHAGFNTDEKKRLAFEASPAAHIFIRKPD